MSPGLVRQHVAAMVASARVQWLTSKKESGEMACLHERQLVMC
jgi:hypothetical protein